MAHFAELDDQNLVQRVVVVDNSILDEDGVEKEEKGEAFLQGMFGPLTQWKQCSYNDNFRGRYARAGSEYIPENDLFSEPRPHASWLLDRTTGTWDAPVAQPAYDPATHYAFWDEPNVQWVVREHPPEFDPQTHYVSWDESSGEWVVSEIPS